MTNLNIVILAAGQGKRMYSALPKILHKIGNKPMLCHVIDTALSLNPQKLIVVYGHGGDAVINQVNFHYSDNKFIWAKQENQLGTGDAMKSALPHIDADGYTLVLYGDVALIHKNTLLDMLEKFQNNIVMLVDKLDDPSGYGRITRDANGRITGIVEDKDATEQQKLINEINTGIYLLPNKNLPTWLANLSNNNKQGEYYLTDIVANAFSDNVSIEYVLSPTHYEITGVNNKVQLQELERIYQTNLANDLLTRGATLADVARIDIRGSLDIGRDVFIDANCIFEGNVVLGDNVTIGAGCILTNVTIEDNVTIKPYSILESSYVGNSSTIGPFSRLRPDTKLANNVHVGNFVEIKKSIINAGSKVNHLTYIGDAIIGSGVNVGAGSVTCNYDGKNKYQTVIEDNSFIGSGTMLVAPVTIGHGSVIGAGSVITKSTPQDELTVARAKQVTITGWKKRNK